MADIQRHLSNGREHIRQFEAEMEPERLREAYMDLENVALSDEHNPRARALFRRECLALWLELLEILDRFLDQNFNPDDLPELSVVPPPTRGGIRYPPGADPSVIDDPVARAEYENAIAAARHKAVHYRLQVQLSRLKDRIPAGVAAFVRNFYSSNPEDLAEVKSEIDKFIKSPRRKADLLNVVEPQHQ